MKRVIPMKISFWVMVTCAVLVAPEILSQSAIMPAELPPGRVSEGLRGVYVTGDPLRLTSENMNVGQRITFVSCPYIRDSEPTPLWFTDYDGETYFLRAQQNLSAAVRHPQLKHKVLIEGIISPEPSVGGGIVLNPLRLSVLPEVDINCDRLLPAADGSFINNPKRPPGPGEDGGAREAGAERNRQNAAKLWAVDYKPDPVERTVKTFEIPFDFDGGIGAYQAYGQVVAAVKYARDVQASKVEIVGHRASVELSNGQTLVERAGVEKDRAETVTTIFNDYLFTQETLVTRWESTPRAADGTADFDKRTATVIVTPGPAPVR
jgi:hypothetical protein